jgi:hypothetical protein
LQQIRRQEPKLSYELALQRAVETTNGEINEAREIEMQQDLGISL